MLADLTPKPEPDTLADRAYSALRSAIVSGDLKAGQKVTERGLANQLDVSPTPVREAIRRLEQDGLLDRTSPRTVRVSLMDDSAQSDLAEVEIALRGMVARFAARHATSEQLDRLDAILDDADDGLIVLKQRHREGADIGRYVTRVFDAIQEFNEGVEGCANNPVLVRLLEQTRMFSRDERRERLLERVATDERFGLDRYGSHRALVHALRRRNSVEAEAIAIGDARGGLSALLSPPNTDD